MNFWIVTPSYNQLEWLKLCVKSVADQVAVDSVKCEDLSVKEKESLKRKAKPLKYRLSEPITVHHHVQDACSTDGTPEWLEWYAQELDEVSSARMPQPKSDGDVAFANTESNAYSFSYASEADEGMYDAINRGWKLAPDDVDVIAHLNCDEQYLPKALKIIAEFFKIHQKVDVVLADMIVVDNDGAYICHRRSLKPYAFSSRYCCGGFTATTFQRAAVTRKKGVFFDTSWRNFGDKVWYNALHKAACRFKVCNQIVATFADTGNNLNWTDEGLRERRLYEEKFLGGRGIGTVVISRINGLRRIIKEVWIKPPKSYRIFQPGGGNQVDMPINHPKGLWHKKWKNN